MIPFSPPRIDDKIIDAVTDTLKSGWLTTGPRTKQFEKNITAYCGNKTTLCLNSATAGLEIMLRWFGVGEGDEVILPAYTYSATANVVMHVGATPVFVDVNADDFNINVDAVARAINSKTKVILPVDFGGYPCDYDALNKLVEATKQEFSARSPLDKSTNLNQQLLGRILILADAAHSFGATYKGKKSGSLTDISVFSFHAVKNLPTAEGGAIALNLPEPFDNDEIYKYLCIYTLHGQTKDALAKMQKGNWRYDIIEAGYKCNMTDIAAAIGIVELDRYDSDMLPKRKWICEKYSKGFSKYDWAEIPVGSWQLAVGNEQPEIPVGNGQLAVGNKQPEIQTGNGQLAVGNKQPEIQTGNGQLAVGNFHPPASNFQLPISSYHLYPLRIKGITEPERDAIMQNIFDQDVSVNVHFIPLPMMSYYKNLGYDIKNYPVAFDNYSREISLPVFYDLSEEQIETVIHAVVTSVEKILATTKV